MKNPFAIALDKIDTIEIIEWDEVVGVGKNGIFLVLLDIVKEQIKS